MAFVLDNSVAMRWAFNDGTTAARFYSAQILQKMVMGDTAYVPNLWALEAANVLANGLKNNTITHARVQNFLNLVGQLDIRVDTQTHANALGATFQNAITYNLSAYDAAYLELSMRLGIDLATVDGGLTLALPKAGVNLA